MDPPDDRLELRRGGLLFLFGRHLSEIDFVHDFLPAISRLGGMEVSRELINAKARLGAFWTVAAQAVRFEKRADYSHEVARHIIA